MGYKYTDINTLIFTESEELNKMRGSDNRFHYFYKITNLNNGKYYYGVHSTTDLYDGYSGSGILLKTAYKKYGIENFTKNIIKFFDDRKSLLEYEKYIVNEELVNSEDCYNLTIGGKGDETIFHKDNYILHTTKGLIHINDGIKNKMIKQKDLNEYINNGWNIGQLHKSTKGKIVIKKENCLERFIYPEDFPKYEKDGWIKGGKSRNRGTVFNSKNKIWINNKIIGKRIYPEDFPKYEKDGWIKGILQKTTKGYIRITNGKEDKNIHPENKELLYFYLNNGWRKGSHVKHNNKSWVSKDGKSIVISKSELKKYLEEGWINTRMPIDNKQKGKVSIYKDDKQKYINKEELELYIKFGWKRGRKKK